jgi:hypothetical protein
MSSLVGVVLVVAPCALVVSFSPIQSVITDDGC